MSFDISMHYPDLPGNRMPDNNYRNPTYNIAPMFALAIGEEEGIRFLDGKTGRECRPILKRAILDMESNMSVYRDLNPENGWGRAEDAVSVLRTLFQWTCMAPDYIMRVR